MLKQSIAGIDVSSAKLDVSAEFDGARREARTFDNDPAGHQELCQWLTHGKREARVVVESTGIYSLDVALALHRTPGIQVMVANPRALRDFARACMLRSKNDPLDAGSTLEYAIRMRFSPWQPPSAKALELRMISRRIAALTVERTREKNRHHALEASKESSRFVLNDIEVNTRHLARRIDGLVVEAKRIVDATPELKSMFDLLVSVTGIATASAIQILPELLVLPEGMTVRQWVAHAGLDPREYKSGSSIDRPVRISKVGNKNLRRALYMPALVASRYETNVKAFYEHLLENGKKPMQAIVAVMRKLLHAIFGMFQSGREFDGNRFYRIPKKA